jgi:general secretion pathway protein G
MNHKKAGFTLIEIMVALLIVGLVAGLSFGAFKYVKQAKVAKTMSQLQALTNTIETYAVQTRSYPQSLDNLLHKPAGVEGWIGNYIEAEEELMDAWNNPFEYRFLGKGQKPAYELYSWGAEGVGSSTGNIGQKGLLN